MISILPAIFDDWGSSGRWWCSHPNECGLRWSGLGQTNPRLISRDSLFQHRESLLLGHLENYPTSTSRPSTHTPWLSCLELSVLSSLKPDPFLNLSRRSSHLTAGCELRAQDCFAWYGLTPLALCTFLHAQLADLNWHRIQFDPDMLCIAVKFR